MSARKPLTKQERLKVKIVEYMLKHFGRDIRDIRLYPAKGVWTHIKMDVMCFTGYGKWHDPAFNNPLTVEFGSWHTMTELLKKGFMIEKDKHGSFELCLIEPEVPATIL